MPDDTARSWKPSYVCTQDVLTKPMQWHEPSRVRLVCDLFHRDVPYRLCDRVFAVMALCPQHSFQVLTEHPERAARYLNRTRHDQGDTWNVAAGCIEAAAWSLIGEPGCTGLLHTRVWPLPNVWLGVPVEDQAAADERVQHLLRCPAAVRYLSCEPLRGAVDLRQVPFRGHPLNHHDGSVLYVGDEGGFDYSWTPRGMLHWVIVGGGVCWGKLDWIRSIVRQCADARVPCFVTQLGSAPIEHDNVFSSGAWPSNQKALVFNDEHVTIWLQDRKGADPSEWPVDLRVRQWPGVTGVAQAAQDAGERT